MLTKFYDLFYFISLTAARSSLTLREQPPPAELPNEAQHTDEPDGCSSPKVG